MLCMGVWAWLVLAHDHSEGAVNRELEKANIAAKQAWLITKACHGTSEHKPPWWREFVKWFWAMIV